MNKHDSILQQRGVVIERAPVREFRLVTFDDVEPPVYGAVLLIGGAEQGLIETSAGEPIQSTSADLIRRYLAQKGFAENVPIATMLLAD